MKEKGYKNGRSDWIRTSDPLLPKQVRYQAAPRSDNLQIQSRTGIDRRLL